MQNSEKIKNEKVLNVRFEEFVNNYEKSSKLIAKYLDISDLNLNRFNIKKTIHNAYKAKTLLSKSEQKLIKIKLNKYLQW